VETTIITNTAVQHEVLLNSVRSAY